MQHKVSITGLSVGQVAERSGVAVSTLHFYESCGLIESWRTKGNQRRYARDVLRSIAIIKVAQRAGVSLQTIRQTFANMAEKKMNKALWEEASRNWRKELDERILRLTRLRDELDYCIGCGCLSLTDCPLRNPEDALGREGSGARILEREDP